MMESVVCKELHDQLLIRESKTLQSYLTMDLEASYIIYLLLCSCLDWSRLLLGYVSSLMHLTLLFNG